MSTSPSAVPAPLPATPPSPGVGARRKGPKSLPTLPLSAFTPPNTGASERFPLPPSPSTVHPDSVVDAHVVSSNVQKWKEQAGEVLGGRLGAVVLSLEGKKDAEVEQIVAGLESSPVQILSALIPFSLESSAHPTFPTAKVPISLTTAFSAPSPNAVESLRWAIEQGRTVDIDIQADISSNDVLWEGFEEILTKATADLPKSTPIILSNILPPPDTQELPIVKLMNHPTYRAYQSHTAALSLFANLYIKFTPPAWEGVTPVTPPSGGSEKESKEKKEWKRRIKMYLGPVLEAFGYQRIIFGSSQSTASKINGASVASDWYEIARESFAELGVEQEVINAVFSGNAHKVYGSS